MDKKSIFKKIKKAFVTFFLFFVSFLLVSCEISNRQPLTVTFIDISGAMSADHTISIKFSEEKSYDDYYIDILLKTETDDITLTLFQEFAKDDEKITIHLNKDDGYVSLDEYKLFNVENQQTDSMVGYADVLATTLVVNSNKEATITFLAVIGEKEEGSFKKIGEVSKEYTLKVRKKESV